MLGAAAGVIAERPITVRHPARADFALHLGSFKLSEISVGIEVNMQTEVVNVDGCTVCLWLVLRHSASRCCSHAQRGPSHASHACAHSSQRRSGAQEPTLTSLIQQSVRCSRADAVIRHPSESCWPVRGGEHRRRGLWPRAVRSGITQTQTRPAQPNHSALLSPSVRAQLATTKQPSVTQASIILGWLHPRPRP